MAFPKKSKSAGKSKKEKLATKDKIDKSVKREKPIPSTGKKTKTPFAILGKAKDHTQLKTMPGGMMAEMPPALTGKSAKRRMKHKAA